MASVSTTIPERQAQIAERFAAAYDVQLRQLTQQAREEQETLTADMEMLRQVGMGHGFLKWEQFWIMLVGICNVSGGSFLESFV